MYTLKMRSVIMDIIFGLLGDFVSPAWDITLK